MSRLLLALLIAFLCASPAQARVARPPLPVPMPQIVIDECPGLPDRGCYIGVGEQDVNGDVWPRGAVFTSGDKFEVSHELGHAFDDSLMDVGERNRFATLLGDPGQPWSESYTDPEGRLIQSPGSLAELFADAYASCRLGYEIEPGRVWVIGYGYHPSGRMHRLICKMIRRAAIDVGTPVAPGGWR